MQEKDILFGQLAIREGYITKEDLLSCLRIQMRADKFLKKHCPLGEIMFFREILGPKEYYELLKLSLVAEEDETVLTLAAPLFGEILVQRNFVSLDQLLECLDIQQMAEIKGLPHRLLGEIMLERGYLNETQLQEALDLTQEESLRMKREGKGRVGRNRSF